VDVIPAVDIRAGRCVRLVRGDFGQETVYSDDPIGVALRWRDEGASRIHVVDLDGAAAGQPLQWELILELITTLGAGAAVQVGGGIRKAADVAAYLDQGADRAILGSAGLKEQETVVNACKRYPGRIVVAVDARDGKVTAEAWHEVSQVDAVELAQELEAAGVPRFLYTDIGRDGTLAGPNVAALGAFIAAMSVPVIASGGVGALNDLESIRATRAEAVIIGRALYEKRFSLQQALQAQT
jgi:phosphoribosylformimino-5-aminoimidazole carboxamide ribotide isomerase